MDAMQSFESPSTVTEVSNVESVNANLVVVESECAK